MTSRKPPSQRDPAYVLHRMNRALQSMVPGSMGGRVANASPVVFAGLAPIVDDPSNSSNPGVGNLGIGEYAGDFGNMTVTPGYAGKVLINLPFGSVGNFGTHVALDDNKHDFHLHGAGIYAVNVSVEILGVSGGSIEGMWAEPNFISGGWQQLGAQTGLFALAWDNAQATTPHGMLLIKTVSASTTISFNIGVEGSLTSANLSVEVSVVKLTDDLLDSGGSDGSGGLSLITSAGGDSMKINEPSGFDVPPTDVVGDSAACISIGQSSIMTNQTSSIMIGNGCEIPIGLHRAGDNILIGDGCSIVMDALGSPGSISASDIIMLGDGCVSSAGGGVSVVIGCGAYITGMIQPDGNPYPSGNFGNTGFFSPTWSKRASDMIAIGDGAYCVGTVDLIAIGDGAVAAGQSEMIAIGDAAAGTPYRVFVHDTIGGRCLPDFDCTAIGPRALANGMESIAIGTRAVAGRDYGTGDGIIDFGGGRTNYTPGGDWHNYVAQEGLIAIGYKAYAGKPNAPLDEAGADHCTAIGWQARATHDHSSAFGADAETTTSNQIVLGTAADTVVIPGSLSAVGITGGGHSIAIANTGGTVTADVSTVEFTGSAITSVTDDGSGHATVTVDQGSGVVESIVAGTGVTVDNTDPANPIVAATGGGAGGPMLTVEASLSLPGFTFPSNVFRVFDTDDGSDQWVTCTVTTLPVVCVAGDGFNARVQLSGYTGSGTPTLGYAEFNVSNMDGTEQIQVYTSTSSAPVTGFNNLHFDSVDGQVGTDLYQPNDVSIDTTAGGVFVVSMTVWFYITP